MMDFLAKYIHTQRQGGKMQGGKVYPNLTAEVSYGKQLNDCAHHRSHLPKYKRSSLSPGHQWELLRQQARPSRNNPVFFTHKREVLTSLCILQLGKKSYGLLPSCPYLLLGFLPLSLSSDTSTFQIIFIEISISTVTLLLEIRNTEYVLGKCNLNCKGYFSGDF